MSNRRNAITAGILLMSATIVAGARAFNGNSMPFSGRKWRDIPPNQLPPASSGGVIRHSHKRRAKQFHGKKLRYCRP